MKKWIYRIADKDVLKNLIGWKMLKMADSKTIIGSNLSGHVILYAWNLIHRMGKPMTLDRMIEILEEEAALFMETSRYDASYGLRRVMLDKRRTSKRKMEKIEISDSGGAIMAVIFPPSKLRYSKLANDKQEKVVSDLTEEAESWEEDPSDED